jgi:hypothetical protein
MIGKEKGAEDKCPSCKGTLVCREVEYKGESKLQWQYKDKEVAHFSYDFKTGKTACKESSDVPKTGTVNTSALQKIDLTGISIPEDQKQQIITASQEAAERLFCVMYGVQLAAEKVKADVYQTGMAYNQVCENRRDTV